MRPSIAMLHSVLVLCTFACVVAAQEHRLLRFEAQRLDQRFMAEGAALVDIDGDSIKDAVNADRWWRGPKFTDSFVFSNAAPFDPARYSETFFIWGDDLDSDGDNDLLVVGFPGKELRWHENPRLGAAQAPSADAPWRRHTVFTGVDNESPAYENLVGDEHREVVAMHDGRMGWIAPTSRGAVHAAWAFHPISAPDLGGAFTHGLGVGDLNDDQRPDVLWKQGFWLQPAAGASSADWSYTAWPFAGPGGAQMLVFDADGDGRADVISAEAAHGYGLVAHLQRSGREGGMGFAAQRLMGSVPRQNLFGCCVGGLHAAALADLSGDGIPDVLTGNRPWAHNGHDPADKGAATLLWFETVRGPAIGAVQFVPHVIDDTTGVGTQVCSDDIEGDGVADIVVSNKRGFSVLHGTAQQVDRSTWQAAGPTAIGDFDPEASAHQDWASIGTAPRNSDGTPMPFDFEDGTLRGWSVEGNAFAGQPVRGDVVHQRRSDMHSYHLGDYWIGTYESPMRDASMGRMVSAPFVLDQPWLSFLVAGGPWPETRVEIVRCDNGTVLAKAHGHESEELAPVAFDLSAALGASVQVRVIDEREGHWGHINFDHLRLHAAEPKFTARAAALGNDVQSSGFPAAVAAARMQVPAGFEVDALASEPTIHQPIAMTIDPRGRIWIAEAYAYPQRQAEGQGRDRILVLEDRDHDSAFETTTVFATGLNLVSGLEVGHGGVFVGAAPYFMFIADANDDLIPDAAPEVLLDGFGFQDTHETLNAFTFGPDGWLYGCHGVFTHSRVGPPGTADKDRVRMNAAVWRWHPTRRIFETFAEGTSNPWGVDFDEHGEAFVSACVIPHLFHIVPGGRYQRQAGAHFEPWLREDIQTIADHRHYVGDSPHDGNNTSDAAGGGHAHCGLLCYLGDGFPAEWRGTLLMDNIHGNRINSDRLRAEHASFNAGHGPDVLLSNDKFFRAIAFRAAPDGGVVFTDWYDRQACHRNEPAIWDRTNGRLYRLRYGAAKAWTEDLTRLDNPALIAMLAHRDVWHERKAREVLSTRVLGPADVALLETQFRGADALLRLRSLWALACTRTLTRQHLAQALHDSAASVRAWGVRLAAEGRALSAAELARCLELAQTDQSAVVRRELASALQRSAPAQRLHILAALAQHTADADDPQIPVLLWMALAPTLAEQPAAGLELVLQGHSPKLTQWCIEHLALLGANATDALARAALANAALQASVLAAFERAVANGQHLHLSATLRQLLETASSEAAHRPAVMRLGGLLGMEQQRKLLRLAVEDVALEGATRLAALRTLAVHPQEEDLACLKAALTHAALADAAVGAIAAMDAASARTTLLEAAASLGAAARARCIAALAARPDSALALLDLVGQQTLPRDILDAPTRRTLALHKDSRVNSALERVWGRVRDSGNATERIDAMLKRFPAAALAQADLPRGRALFARTCRNCHKLFDDGRTVGPELTGANRSDLRYLLTNILDPSGEVPNEYRLLNMRLEDGRLLSGVLGQSNESSLELLAQDATHRVLRADIAMGADGTPDLWQGEASMMPDDQLTGFAPEEIRDLLAYLRAPAQVPLRADERTLPLFFDGATLSLFSGDPAVWSVVNGSIVGKTTGLERNSFLLSALQIADFRLTLDVELHDNLGNSGIQFRSVPQGIEDVAGYQADIGPGWWGKLYEEHGRGVLSSPPPLGGPGVHHYEIVAVGSRIMMAIDGIQCCDLDDPVGRREGRIAFQVHSGGPTEVRFSNIRLAFATTARLQSLK